ncbi:hypothetical protein F5B20DRAFT_199856 [Whalleya microplaca]|nr:hypothetical protein F5B20DRAFT_199856 [Whalleya microplaca]
MMDKPQAPPPFSYAAIAGGKHTPSPQPVFNKGRNDKVDASHQSSPKKVLRLQNKARTSTSTSINVKDSDTPVPSDAARSTLKTSPKNQAIEDDAVICAKLRSKDDKPSQLRDATNSRKVSTGSAPNSQRVASNSAPQIASSTEMPKDSTSSKAKNKKKQKKPQNKSQGATQTYNARVSSQAQMPQTPTPAQTGHSREPSRAMGAFVQRPLELNAPKQAPEASTSAGAGRLETPKRFQHGLHTKATESRDATAITESTANRDAQRVAQIQGQLSSAQATISVLQNDLGRKTDDLIEAKTALALKEAEVQELMNARNAVASLEHDVHALRMEVSHRDNYISELRSEAWSLRQAIQTGVLSIAHIYGSPAGPQFTSMVEERIGYMGPHPGPPPQWPAAGSNGLPFNTFSPVYSTNPSGSRGSGDSSYLNSGSGSNRSSGVVVDMTGHPAAAELGAEPIKASIEADDSTPVPEGSSPVEDVAALVANLDGNADLRRGTFAYPAKEQNPQASSTPEKFETSYEPSASSTASFPKDGPAEVPEAPSEPKQASPTKSVETPLPRSDPREDFPALPGSTIGDNETGSPHPVPSTSTQPPPRKASWAAIASPNPSSEQSNLMRKKNKRFTLRSSPKLAADDNDADNNDADEVDDKHPLKVEVVLEEGWELAKPSKAKQRKSKSPTPPQQQQPRQQQKKWGAPAQAQKKRQHYTGSGTVIGSKSGFSGSPADPSSVDGKKDESNRAFPKDGKKNESRQTSPKDRKGSDTKPSPPPGAAKNEGTAQNEKAYRPPGAGWVNSQGKKPGQNNNRRNQGPRAGNQPGAGNQDRFDGPWRKQWGSGTQNAGNPANRGNSGPQNTGTGNGNARASSGGKNSGKPAAPAAASSTDAALGSTGATFSWADEVEELFASQKV